MSSSTLPFSSFNENKNNPNKKQTNIHTYKHKNTTQMGDNSANQPSTTTNTVTAAAVTAVTAAVAATEISAASASVTAATAAPTTSEESKAEQPMTEARKMLVSFLNKRLRIELSDGRVVCGVFICTDNECNVVLGSAVEYGPPDTADGSREQQRHLNTVMVPGAHIVDLAVCLDDDNNNSNSKSGNARAGAAAAGNAAAAGEEALAVLAAAAAEAETVVVPPKK